MDGKVYLEFEEFSHIILCRCDDDRYFITSDELREYRDLYDYLYSLCEFLVKQGERDFLLNTIRFNSSVSLNGHQIKLDIDQLKLIVDWENWR